MPKSRSDLPGTASPTQSSPRRLCWISCGAKAAKSGQKPILAKVQIGASAESNEWLYVLAAVDVNFGAVDVRRRLRAQDVNDFRNLVRRA